MRATAPAGDARFEGVEAWSGELGYGVRAPEPHQSAENGGLAASEAESGQSSVEAHP